MPFTAWSAAVLLLEYLAYERFTFFFQVGCLRMSGNVFLIDRCKCSRCSLTRGKNSRRLLDWRFGHALDDMSLGYSMQFFPRQDETAVEWSYKGELTFAIRCRCVGCATGRGCCFKPRIFLLMGFLSGGVTCITIVFGSDV